MDGCIYIITNLANGKKYVGQHCTPDHLARFKGHICSANRGSKLILHKAMRKHGVENFICELLCVVPVEGLANMEGYWAEQYGCYMWDPEPGYNMVWCSKSFNLGVKKSPEANEKNRQAHLGLKHSPEACENMRLAQLGKKISPEAREKMRQAQLGKKKSPEHIEKVRQANLGRKMSPEACEKVRQANLGRKHSPETREKVRLAQLGKKKSPEACENMRLAQQKRWAAATPIINNL